MRIAILVLFLVGCSDPYGDCIEREKESYRVAHPKASYGEIQYRTKDFELTCSRYKKG